MLQMEIRRCLVKHRGLDQNADGELAGDELEPVRRMVKELDRNVDEKLDDTELRSACVSGLLTDRQNPSSSSN